MSSANPWVELFENDMNFVLNHTTATYNTTTHVPAVTNGAVSPTAPSPWITAAARSRSTIR